MKREETDSSKDDETGVEIHDTLDTVGLLCPAPIIKTAERMNELEAGQVLEVVSDDPGIQVDMPAWCRSAGHEFLGMKKIGRDLHGLIRKGTGRS